jgi:hypothetical protein
LRRSFYRVIEKNGARSRAYNERGRFMKKLTSFLLVLAIIGVSGCSAKFWGGVGGGAVGAGAAYEINAALAKDRIDDDLKDGKIDQREYDIRMDQIERMSLYYKLK